LISPTNILEAFTHADPKSEKNASKLSFFTLLESACIKTDRKMLVKLTPAVNFIIILQAAFVPIFFCQKNTKPNCN
jgi:hypothetical protein